MPPIEVGPSRPIGAVDVRIARLAQGGARQAEKAATAVPAAEIPVVRSQALDPGEAPVDAERVQMIRKAVETGTYPVVPAKVADAIIAAGILLRVGGK